MNKLITTACVAALALAAPAIALGASPSSSDQKNAAKYCKQLRSSSGSQNFTAMFGGGHNAFGKCVSRKARENAVQDQQNQEQAQKNAAKECRAEQADPNFASTHNGNTFAQQYGTGNGHNAFGKCVSQHARQNEQEAEQQDQQEDQNDVNAAKQCRAEQKDSGFAAAHDGKSFTQFYGTNSNGRNAFGKCVSKKARAMNQDQEQEGGSSQS